MSCNPMKPFKKSFGKGKVKNFALPHGGFVGSVKNIDKLQRSGMKPPKARFKKPSRSGY